MSNDTLFKATVMIFVDLENSPNDPKTITGGRATHNLYEHNTHSYPTLNELVDELTHMYGLPYDQIDNRLFFHINQDKWSCVECPENYDVSIEMITQVDVNEELLKLVVKEVVSNE